MGRFGMHGISEQQAGQGSVARCPAHDLVIVDDDGHALAEIAEALTHLGHCPVTFTRPADAMAHLLRRTRPAIVVADVCMPGMTGLELTRALGEQKGVPPAEIILMSANSGINEAIQAVQAGAVDFLIKPVDLIALASTIGRAGARIVEWQTEQDQRSKLADLVTVMVEKARDLLGDPLPPQSGQAAPSSLPAPLADAPPIQRLGLIKLLQGIRRQRDRLFECCSDGDADWEILLFLREQEVLDRTVSVTSACHAVAIPQTTAMRKIDELVDAGLLTRQPDPGDRRRVLVRTTPRCSEALDRYLETVGRQIVSTFQTLP